MNEKKIYAIYWDEEEQDRYLRLTDKEYNNVISVLTRLGILDMVDLEEIEVEDF